MSLRPAALRQPLPLALVALALVTLIACRSQPELDVQAAAAATPAAPAAAPAHAPSSSAPPIAPGAEMPPGHPPVDGTAGEASSVPPGHPPVSPPADAVQAVAGTVRAGGEGAQGVSWTPPAGWVSEPPANNMRRAQYRIPGPRGDAECVVFYFGPGQGGDPRSNAERWASQFVNADGTPATSAMKTRATESNGLKVLYVETRGTYAAGMMAGGAGEPKAGYALLGAIVEGPDSNWFFKLTGPAATVDAQRAAFESMIGGIKRGG
jgi:hypothetical protein